MSSAPQPEPHAPAVTRMRSPATVVSAVLPDEPDAGAAPPATAVSDAVVVRGHALQQERQSRRPRPRRPPPRTRSAAPLAQAIPVGAGGSARSRDRRVPWPSSSGKYARRRRVVEHDAEGERRGVRIVAARGELEREALVRLVERVADHRHVHGHVRAARRAGEERQRSRRGREIPTPPRWRCPDRAPGDRLREHRRVAVRLRKVPSLRDAPRAVPARDRETQRAVEHSVACVGAAPSGRETQGEGLVALVRRGFRQDGHVHRRRGRARCERQRARSRGVVDVRGRGAVGCRVRHDGRGRGGERGARDPASSRPPSSRPRCRATTTARSPGSAGRPGRRRGHRRARCGARRRRSAPPDRSPARPGDAAVGPPDLGPVRVVRPDEVLRPPWLAPHRVGRPRPDTSLCGPATSRRPSPSPHRCRRCPTARSPAGCKWAAPTARRRARGRQPYVSRHENTRPGRGPRRVPFRRRYRPSSTAPSPSRRLESREERDVPGRDEPCCPTGRRSTSCRPRCRRSTRWPGVRGAAGLQEDSRRRAVPRASRRASPRHTVLGRPVPSPERPVCREQQPAAERHELPERAFGTGDEVGDDRGAGGRAVAAPQVAVDRAAPYSSASGPIVGPAPVHARPT